MKRMLNAVVITLIASAATAQTAVPPANTKPQTPPVSNSDRTNPSAPAAGANSFTEAQAKSRIEGKGFSNVSALVKDKDGVWRGTASHSGATHNVALDYQGNVISQ